jgi:hypothetical protein
MSRVGGFEIMPTCGGGDGHVVMMVTASGWVRTNMMFS